MLDTMYEALKIEFKRGECGILIPKRIFDVKSVVREY